jgi:hypothetical protein
MDKQRMEHDNLERIGNDRVEIDNLIRELDLIKKDNWAVEDEQMRILDNISEAEREVAAKSVELASYRQQASVEDQANLNLRKEIEYQERIVGEQKSISNSNYDTLVRLRDNQHRLDKELEAQDKRVHVLQVEYENNDQRIQS